ncbi:CRISPR-associated protein Cse2 (CRISPR_cse2) [Caballeronia catudaia]|uniref:CRISPR-associated protein Cse2 (CRISPR_cse2) n=1 Tax=Caballeronia catudaia TaxID=1777136 RepID=A0A158C6I7_9BURK|nr:type I-E CRISPR-associated protein Cse2/CasB [Caballeronia catudaia]SAK77526.1 CRISPR-associated protein Cse2 (CRISPR_cse2) [Caballeronia catudaia]
MTSVEDTALGSRRSFYAQIGAMTGFIKAGKDGEGSVKADYVALARLDPNAQTLTVQQIAALTRALQRAKVDCDYFSPMRWRRWGLIAHGIALAVHSPADESRQRLGEQLHRAGVSEPRVTRLLNARGEALFQNLPRILRLMASRGVAPNWVEFGTLILNEGAANPLGKRIAEKTRIAIVRDYARARLKSERK